MNKFGLSSIGSNVFRKKLNPIAHTHSFVVDPSTSVDEGLASVIFIV